MPKRWLVKRRLLVVFEATMYTRIYVWAAAIREVLVCSTEPTNVRKIFITELYSHKIFCMFSVYESIFTTKIKRITVMSCSHEIMLLLLLVVLEMDDGKGLGMRLA